MYRCLPLFATIIFLASVLSTSSVRAANPDLEAWTSGAMATRVDRGGPEFRFNVGGGFGFAPDYHGSDDYGIQFLPLVDIEWRGAYFLSTQRGLGLNLIRRRQTRAGPRITRAAARKKTLNTDLSAATDLDPSYELGLFGEHFRGPWRFDADIRYGLNKTGHHGVIASAGVALGGRLSELSSLIVGGKFHWANADYMVANYGVPSVYTPTGGLRDLVGYASVVYNVTDQIYLSIDGRGEMLMDQVSLSPIVKADMQYFLGTVLGVHF
jgi:outer membrane scaffolding protein for murein synthesis (MipA/OmpV family)